VADIDEASTLVRPRNDEAKHAVFALTVIDGPDEGARFQLDSSAPCPVLLGQSPACEVRLSDREASRRHAAIEVAGARVRVRDLGSTNGTYVEGVLVFDALMFPGESVRIGSTTLRLELLSEPAASLPSTDRFGRVLGASPEMRRLYPLIERFASSTIPVIIEGETGTGKEVLAEAMHEAGPRAAGPYVVFDCTAVPPNLVESELFGHERGAFTGALASRKGVFEQAHGGTLLIDEIGDLDLALQPKLLRALERSEVRRVGGDGPIRVDVRVFAATRRDLDHEVQAGRFRDDLFHRLAVGRIELPPLRRRKGDVALLVRHFWTELGGRGAPPAELLARWQDDPWPGNVRELRNACARHITIGDLTPADLPDEAPAQPARGDDVIGGVIAEGLPLAIARLRVVEAFERRYIEHVLEQNEGNVSRAARASGIGRRYFQMLRKRR
jgi:DNA-binding NtrC family response regulator